MTYDGQYNKQFCVIHLLILTDTIIGMKMGELREEIGIKNTSENEGSGDQTAMGRTQDTGHRTLIENAILRTEGFSQIVDRYVRVDKPKESMENRRGW